MSEAEQDPIPPPPPTTKRTLGATLSAEYEALRNDVQQATEMAADFQRQLAGKSNEFADLKRIFEKTATDLAEMQATIEQLRDERHRLANDAMRAIAFEQKLASTIAERDRLRTELVAMRHQSAPEVEKLTLEVATLRDQLAKAQRENSVRIPLRSSPSDVPALLSEIAVSFERLRAMLNSAADAKPQSSPAPLWMRDDASADDIAISFEK